MRKEQPINEHVERKLQKWRKDMREEDLPRVYHMLLTQLLYVSVSTVLERAWISSPPTGRVYQSQRERI